MKTGITFFLFCTVLCTIPACKSKKGSQLKSNFEGDSLQNICNVITAFESDFEIDEKGTITAYHGQNAMVVIPARIDGIPVRAIGDDAFNFKGLTDVIIPVGVTSIGKRAFAENSLKVVSIPKSVTFIGHAAFCLNNIISITIDSNVTVEWTEHESYPHASEYPEFTDLYNTNGKKAGTYAYVDLDSEWNLNGETIRAFDKTENGFTIDTKGIILAYKGRDTLLVIPAQVAGVPVTAIGSEAFKGKGLTSVTIHNGITAIGYRAFQNNRLTSVTIGAGVELMAFFTGDPPYMNPYFSFDHGFDAYCYYVNGNKAGTYEYSDNRWSMNGEIIMAYEDTENGYFVIDGKGTIMDYRGDVAVVIPAQVAGIPVTSVGNRAFWSLDHVGYTNVTIPACITFIGERAFYDIILASVTIGANVTLAGNSFACGFDDFYDTNGKKAGTYVYSYCDEKWNMR